MRRSFAALAIAAVTFTAACGEATETAAPAANAPAAAAYRAGSDVDADAAIGTDAEKIRELLSPAKEGKPVDWSAVKQVVAEGGASKKGDGSFRTLGGLAEEHHATAHLTAALAGGETDAIRAQHVDKAITVILADKVIGELDAAANKVEKKELDAKSGAPHNVDEAWAFFDANAQGPAQTADKRAKDFAREGKVREPIVTALQAAQAAAVAGDAAALEKATADVRSGLDYVFYLATFKYLDHGGDAVKKAEGSTFYLGIADRVRAAAPKADSAITAALASGDAAAGRAALNSPEVLTALGIDATETVTA